MNRKVLHASLHKTSNHVPVVGELGHTFPTQGKTLDNLHMWVSEHGLHLKYAYKGQKLETMFPLAAVSVLSLAPEESE
jgi:hypothetical protein